MSAAKKSPAAAGAGVLDRRHDLAIVHKPVAELIPYARNARTHSDAQVEQLVGSMQQFGWTNPVLLDEGGTIIAGHGRVMAARKLRLKDVPCIVLPGLTATEKQALVLADNKLALNSGWDNELLLMELGEIAESGMDLNIVGFSQPEMDALLGQVDVPDLMDPTDGEGQTQGEGQPMLAWGKTRVPLTAEEIARLDRAYADHVAIQGVSFGFIRSLIVGR